MMYVSVWPSEALARQRSHGCIALSVQRFGAASRVAALRESGPSRLRLPRTGSHALEAVVINTGGGIACGDRYDLDISAGMGAELTVTNPGAEKVYKSNGPMAHMNVQLKVEEEASLAWLPQETIVFNQARLTRSFEVKLAAGSRFLLAEMVVFGRAAFHEEVIDGHFEDRWRIRRGGRLVYADTLRLSGAISDLLRSPSVAGGATAIATVLYAAADAEARLEEARDILGQAGSGQMAAIAWNGLLALRFISPTIAELRRHVVHFLVHFRNQSMPRVWQT
jgi:urease accessory protein